MFRKIMASTTEENYLKALFNLSNSTGEVGISDLAQSLQVSLPTANSMVKSLQKGGWVIYEKYKPVVLTLEGKSCCTGHPQTPADRNVFGEKNGFWLGGSP